jgi:hypothetical protein
MMQEAILRCEKGSAATGECECGCEVAADARHAPSASMMAPKITLMDIARVAYGGANLGRCTISTSQARRRCECRPVQCICDGVT